MTADPSPRQKPLACGLMLIIALFIISALVAFVFWRMETWPLRTAQQSAAELERIAGKVRDAFVQIAQLQPQVRINNRVYLEQTTAVAELAVITRQMEVEHEFAHTWAGSTKRVKLHGTFAVKAGFDLQQHVSADVRDDVIAIEVPHAQILGVEQQKVEVQELENGYWNWISTSDLENELAALPRLAREKATEGGLSREAEETLRKQLEQRIGAARPLQLRFSGDTPTKQ